MAESPTPLLNSPQIVLPPSVESMIDTICREQSQPSPGSAARQELDSLGEEKSLEILQVIRGSKIAKTFNGFIVHLARRRKSQGETTTVVNKVADTSGTSGLQRLSPQFLALEGLEFKRIFLLLTYIGRNKLEDVISLEEIQSLRVRGEQRSMASYESLIWNEFGQHFCEKTDRLKHRNWDHRRICYYYHCHVYSDGSYSFKGPFLNSSTTLLHRVLQEENVLLVKFSEDTQISTTKVLRKGLHSSFHKVAQEGVWLGHKCYRFFAFKDGGKEAKKKDPTSSSVKCYFVNMESLAQAYKLLPSSPGKLSVHEARCIFMHVHNVSSISAYMIRFSLILSKTTKLEASLDEIHVQDIDDIACKNEDGSFVYSEDGKLLIQTDGTSFIPEDLAL